MVHVPERKAFSGPALIRLLARLTDAGVPASGQPLADRLGHWLGWTDAIALSTALSGHPSAADTRGAASDSTEDALCMRVRTSLSNAIARDATLAPERQRSAARGRHVSQAPVDDTPPDYAVFRQCYLARQEDMESAIGDLRARLRTRLAGRQPAMARLAAVDAVMERVLGARERVSLAAVPGLLSMHFERLRAAAQAARDAQDGQDAQAAHAASGPDTLPAQPPTVNANAWLDVFRKDMQSVLFAELEVRFQPVEGLLAALRDC
jgi:hypothetical protein